MGRRSGAGEDTLCPPGSARRQVQHLVNAAFISDQISGYQFLAGSVQFVRETDVQQLRQARVGIEADSILIRDRYQDEVEQLLQTGQALVESLAEKAVIHPAKGATNGTSAIGAGRLGPGLHFSLDEFKVEEAVRGGYRILWDVSFRQGCVGRVPMWAGTQKQ
jgi:hypothetical protein